MDYSVETESGEVSRNLQMEFEALRNNFMQSVADTAGEKIAEVIFLSSPTGRLAPGGGKRSDFGQPPAIVSRELVTSLQSRLVDRDEVEVEMAGHGFFLDPVFKGSGKGGGYLERPFIETGLEKAFIEEGKEL